MDLGYHTKLTTLLSNSIRLATFSPLWNSIQTEEELMIFWARGKTSNLIVLGGLSL